MFGFINLLRRAAFIGIGALCSLSGMAHAAPINLPVPSNAYITFGGLHWAWANPVASNTAFCNGCGVDLSYQSQFGWRIPTAAEMANAPLASHFVFPGANVPLFGTDPNSGAFFNFTDASTVLIGSAASAVPYFSLRFLVANFCNAPGSGCTVASNVNRPWWGQPGAPTFAEALVVRDAPEPSTIALIAMAMLSLFGFGLMRRRADA